MAGSGSPLALHLKQSRVSTLESVQEAEHYLRVVSGYSPPSILNGKESYLESTEHINFENAVQHSR